MRNIRNTMELIEYVSRPICNDYRNTFYEINEISEKKCSIYFNIVKSLFDRVEETYLGDEVMFARYNELGEYDIEKHFTWCWFKSLVDNGLCFMDDTELRRYFMNYFKESFYYESKKNYNFNKNLDYWYNTFNLNTQKTKSELETLLDLHHIFDKTFLNKL